MSKTQEALKLELRRIRAMIGQVTGLDDEDEDNLRDAYKSIGQIIDAMAEQPAQQEPVAWRSWNDHDGYGFWETKHEAEPWCAPDFFAEPLYTSPPPAQQQEPLVTKNKSGITLHVGWDDLPVGTKLYTSPPASKPLTDEAKAVIDAARAAMDDSVEAYDSEGSIKISSDLAASLSLCLDEYDRAIEAAHGIKGDA